MASSSLRLRPIVVGSLLLRGLPPLAAVLTVTLSLALGAPAARAADRVYWSVGVSPAPGVVINAGNAPPPRVYVSPPVYVSPAPTVYSNVPQAVYPQPVYSQPVYTEPIDPQLGYSQPPVQYTQPPVLYTQPQVVYTSAPVVYSSTSYYPPPPPVVIVRPGPGFGPPGYWSPGYYGYGGHNGHGGHIGHGGHGGHPGGEGPGRGPQGHGRY